MAKTELHLGSNNYLYYKGGRSVRYKGNPVYQWDSSTKRWSACGSEVKEYKGKTIFDLEKILWCFEFVFYKRIFILFFLFF